MKRPGATSPGRPRTAGFSLLEILVAVVILAIGIIAIAGIFPASSGIISQAGREVSAGGVAQEEIERLRRLAWTHASLAPNVEGQPCPAFDPQDPPAAYGSAPRRLLAAGTQGLDRTFAVWVCVSRPFSADTVPDPFLKEIAVAVAYRNVGEEIAEVHRAYRARE